MADQPPETILVVDDDDAKRHAIVKILRKAGYTIREAINGREGLRFAAEKPALIILDVKLPDISGFEVCRILKEDPTTAATPILHISTTFVDMEDRIQGLEGGADGYLTDVQEPLELIATVKALLRTRKAEEAAVITARQWQVTFDAISDGVLLLDREGRAMQINSAMEKILGDSWNEPRDRTIHDLLPLPVDPAESPFLRMLASGRREAIELTMGSRWLRITVDPIRDPAGIVRGGLCITSDMTDRWRLEEELRRRAEELVVADQRKDEFLAMLAHELRNPLAPIANALEVIRLDRSDGAVTDESLDIARRQVGHMARLLDDLLDVARFTRGNVQLRMVPVDLSTILEQAIETSRPLIEAVDHRLVTSLPDEPVWLNGDPTRLAQVVSNLLNNAAKYTDRGGEIHLTARIQADEVVIRVRDNGIGLSREMLPRVFDLFAQEDRSLDRSQGGLGIGLTLVRSLVNLHGGKIEVESRGLGLGSEFTVHLPISGTHPTEQNTHTESAAVTLAVRHARVLIVDDIQDSARSLARVLRHWGYQVGVAHDGREAIEVVLAEEFDIVLLDIGLPEKDGYQVAQEIRRYFEGQGPTLVALTGYGQDSDLTRAKDAGFDHHLVKPVNLDRLKKLLAGLASPTNGEPQETGTKL